jgi:N-acylneuraminate cytidylyltransferase/CMP-N,N'-diacetyllegionaminic acid synthase
MAFIPARGGSKGIPRKNLVPLAGKPLLQYTIEAAHKSKHITDIFLSSEDEEIIELARSLGLEVPYRRPAELATDESPLIDAILHACDWLRANRHPTPDALLLLQPTSPLRRADDIDKAIQLFQVTGATSLISVHKMIEHPYDCLVVKRKRWRYLARGNSAITRRQEYPENFYYLNGAMYMARTDFLVARRAFVIEGETILYPMNPALGVDVDTIFDLQRAEFYLKWLSEQPGHPEDTSKVNLKAETD